MEMKCLDLFSGTRSIAKAFKIKGFETFTIELDRQHKNIVLFSFYAIFLNLLHILLTIFHILFDTVALKYRLQNEY